MTVSGYQKKSQKNIYARFFDEGNQSWVWIESHPFNRQTPRWILEFSKQTNGGTIVYLELPKRKIKMMTNVLIIEDDPMVAELNRTFVESILI